MNTGYPGAVERERTLAVFSDFENLAIGAREAKLGPLDVDAILRGLDAEGRPVILRAYADWKRYGSERRALHLAGFELLDVPALHYSGKNSADIQMVVDALDICHTHPHVETFVVLSGDSDFSPLVRRLRERGKRVVGMGVRHATSQMLVEICDAFILYDDLINGSAHAGDSVPDVPKPFRDLVDKARDLIGSRRGEVRGSMVKQALVRDNPGFDETEHGFRAFGQMLRAARREGFLELRADERSGDFVIEAVHGN